MGIFPGLKGGEKQCDGKCFWGCGDGDSRGLSPVWRPDSAGIPDSGGAEAFSLPKGAGAVDQQRHFPDAEELPYLFLGLIIVGLLCD